MTKHPYQRLRRRANTRKVCRVMLSFNALLKWPAIVTTITFLATLILFGLAGLAYSYQHKTEVADSSLMIAGFISLTVLVIYYLGWAILLIVALTVYEDKKYDPLDSQLKIESYLLADAIGDYVLLHAHLDNPMLNFETDIPPLQMEEDDFLPTKVPEYQCLRQQVIKCQKRKKLRSVHDILTSMMWITVGGSVVGILLMYRDWDETNHTQYLCVDLILAAISGVFALFVMYSAIWLISYVFVSGTDMNRDLKISKRHEIQMRRLFRHKVEQFNLDYVRESDS